MEVGRSIFENAILLKSGYIVVPYQKNANANMYMLPYTSDVVFTTSNFTGQAYVGQSMEYRLFAREVGVLAGIGNQAYYLELPSRDQGIVINSRKSVGQACYSFADFIPYEKTRFCVNDGNLYNYPPGTRVREVFSSTGSYCDWITWYNLPSSTFKITPNDSQVTGIKTNFCNETDGSPAVCLTNAIIKRE